MPEYTLPHLSSIAPDELVDYLAGLGIAAEVYDQTGLTIHTDVDATAAIAAFVPASTFNRQAFISDYVPPVPTTAAVAAHLQHLRDFRNAIRNGTLPVPTLAQTQHVVADIIDALRLIDARLDRDA